MWPDGYIIIIIQSLAIYNNDNLPSSIKMTKLVQKFDKYQINYPQKLPKDFQNFDKMAKFRQIRSHCD